MSKLEELVKERNAQVFRIVVVTDKNYSDGVAGENGEGGEKTSATSPRSVLKPGDDEEGAFSGTAHGQSVIGKLRH